MACGCILSGRGGSLCVHCSGFVCILWCIVCECPLTPSGTWVGYDCTMLEGFKAFQVQGPDLIECTSQDSFAEMQLRSCCCHNNYCRAVIVEGLQWFNVSVA